MWTDCVMGCAPLLFSRPAPHFLVGEGVNGPARLRLGLSLEDGLGQDQIGPGRDLDIGRRPFHNVDRMAGGFEELSIIGDRSTELGAACIGGLQPVTAKYL